MKDLTPIVAHNLTELRKGRGLTQGELAERFAYSDKTVSKWEHAEVVPDLNTLQQLADFYGVTIDYLTHEQNDISLQEQGHNDPEVQKINRNVLTALAVVFIWTLASVFCAGFMLFPRQWTPWMAFIWALPLSFLTLFYFNRKWGEARWELPLSLCQAWTLVIAVYLEVSLDLGSWRMWFLLLMIIPLTVGAVFSARLHRQL